MDTETTGLDPKKHTIIEFSCVLVDDSYNPYQGVVPFTKLIQPYGEIDPAAGNKGLVQRATETGLTREACLNMFERWVGALPFPPGTRIPPMGFNYSAFDMGMLRAFMGDAYYDSIFHHLVRDPLTVQLFLDDTLGRPRITYKLGELCKLYGVQLINAHNAYEDIVATIMLYKTMVNKLKPYIDMVNVRE